MAGTTPRQQRVGDQIQRELAELIRREVKDPRLHPLATVSEVRVSADLGHARVYVSVLGDEAAARDSVDALNHAAGYLRGLLGRRLHLRTIPQLKFIHDTSAERGQRLSALIAEAVAADRRRQEDQD
ncbi:MAG: ribosome-binding factor A [Gammaproteobacteria bacterium]|nr:MAG: ribosome-binding factor A [Gammaproteobacteria bacterium]